MKYNFTEIEKKWQAYWEENKTFKAEIDHSKPKYYILDFFPYPSGDGLHVGHTEGYTATDIMARYKRMRGFNVLHPMGWDAFGLPAEQYAVKTGVHPRITTIKSIENFKRQLKALGFSYDWDREIATINSKYYKWTQWIFLQLYNMGLAYQAEVAVNWSPELGTVLANEEVPEQIEKGFTVERRLMKQWMLKITEYAERLLIDLDMLDWPESTKKMQRNWIGKSEGAKVKFKLTPALSEGEGVEEVNDGSDKPGYHNTSAETGDTSKINARDNRKNATDAESIMWENLRNSKLGCRIRRQHAIGKYIVDFVCISKRLVIEIDGGIHENHLDQDEIRTKELNDIGFSVIRFTNDEVLFKTTQVLEKIKKASDKKIIDYKDIDSESSDAIDDESDSLSFGEGQGEVRTLELEIFTTRPDTLWGATYVVLAPEHPFVDLITTEEHKTEVVSYRASVKNKSDLERQQLEKEKTGVFTGAYAVNPVNNKNIPVWISDYVMMSYGTGAIMAVPAHDQRDWEFAKKYGLPINEVVKPAGNADIDISKEAFSAEGIAINSGFINGLKTDKAKRKVIEWLEKNELGAGSVQYKLRDWLFSRQRFWGEPFPLIHLNDGTVKSVPVEDLPVALPEIDSYLPTGTGESPLAAFPEWLNTTDKETGLPARRETNTMPQWAGSCWYYLRFLDPDNENEFCSKEKEKYWMPVNLYLGGSEHAVLHLLYARFWHKVLFDLGLVSTREPFVRLYHQGMILGEDSNKMSKSRGNVINPDDVIAEYGADSLRLFEMFLGPLSSTKPWSTQGIEGVFRLLNRIWRLVIDENGNISSAVQDVQPDNETEMLMHRTIKKITDDIEDTDLKFNTSVSEMMIYMNEISRLETVPRIIVETLLKLIAPFAPHIAEELWQRLGNTGSIAFVGWPVFNPAKVVKNIVTIVVQVNGKVRGKFEVDINLDDEKVKEIVKQDSKIKSYLDGKEIVKEIVVKNKLVNLVVK